VDRDLKRALSIAETHEQTTVKRAYQGAGERPPGLPQNGKK